MRTLVRLAAVVMLTAVGAASLSSQPQPLAAPAAQQPTFRTGVNYVRADVYPTANGQIVRDLRPEDFELREDGVPQKLDSVRFVDPGPPTPQAVRVEPNSVAESRAAAADPRARLFIIFVDTYHIHWTSSYQAHHAFVEMLGQGMGEHDLVGVMTPEMSAASVTFGRRTSVVEEVLQRHFALSRSRDSLAVDEEDNLYYGCYGPGNPAEAMIDRRHETLTLDALKDLVIFVGGIREERKAIFFLSDGWVPTRADPALANWSDGMPPGMKKPSVGPDGRLRAGGTEFEQGGSNRRMCDQKRIKLAGEDHQAEFQRLLDLANRHNATFYSVDLGGLGMRGQGPGMKAPIDARAPVGQEMLKTLSGATDGVAVVDTNDLVTGMRRAHGGHARLLSARLLLEQREGRRDVPVDQGLREAVRRERASPTRLPGGLSEGDEGDGRGGAGLRATTDAVPVESGLRGDRRAVGASENPPGSGRAGAGWLHLAHRRGRRYRRRLSGWRGSSTWPRWLGSSSGIRGPTSRWK